MRKGKCNPISWDFSMDQVTHFTPPKGRDKQNRKLKRKTHMGYCCHFKKKKISFLTINLKSYRKNKVRATGVERESITFIIIIIKMSPNIQKTWKIFSGILYMLTH